MNNLSSMSDIVNAENIPAGVAVVTFDGISMKVEYVSPLYCELFDYTKEEYLALPVNRYGLRLECVGDFARKFKQFITKSNSADRFSINIEILKKNGKSVNTRLSFKATEKDSQRTRYLILAAPLGEPSADSEKNMDRQLLKNAAELAGDYLMEYDFKTEVTTVYKFENENLVVDNVYSDFMNQILDMKMIEEDDIDTFKNFCENITAGYKNLYCEVRFLDPNTSLMQWHSFKTQTTFDAAGNPVRLTGIIKNISLNKESELRLIDKAERDPLTKIYNKSTTTSLIKGYLRSDSRENLDALIIVDVDNFKSVNDNLGHLFGDSVLLDLSQEMQDLFRTSDVVGRIGGDEFVVFLRGVKQKKHIADKANDICRIFELLYSGENGDKITGSLGVSIFPQDGDTYDELFKKADVALYYSKAQGKNCFTFYEDVKDNDHAEVQAQVDTARYMKDIPISSYNNDYDTVITDFAFDIMNKTKDVSSAIVMLLSKVGKHFDLSRVSIMEVVEQSFSLKYTYQWCAKGIESEIGKTVLKNREQWVKSMDAYDENDISCITDLSLVDTEIDEYTLQSYLASGAKSLIECAIFDSGEYRGHVSFVDCKNSREWSMEEVKTLKTISKIVSSYLLKMRAFERANKMVDRLTNYDSLTDLPKLNVFKEYANEHLQNAIVGERFALLYLDFNNFKYVNEKLGSENGDRILISFSEGLRKLNNNVKCCSRIYSDKYVMFTKLSDNEDILDELRRYVDLFTGKERFKNPECPITISAGIYDISIPSEVDINKAMDNANIARKQAKLLNDNNCVMYNEEMKHEINAALEIVNEAEQAIINREFVVYYQPKICIKTGKLLGAEALIRWKKPDGRIVPPNDFIPYLEKSGFIVNIDFYVFERVCKFIRADIDAGNLVVPISVNVSRLHIKNPNFVNDVVNLVSKYRIPPQYMEFELTENAFLDDQNAAISVIKELREMGFSVSIDDFGSGYSSLNLLKTLPVNVLKMDREFFMKNAVAGNDAIIISSIIDMANRMDISVVCEGVETEEQIEFLKSTNCTSVQGFYYSKPIPKDEFVFYKNKMTQ